ncbi:hypothetical protein A3Q56_03861 [Intoshia linei]|uniref:Uncharacterized protein n=1 Tax=Intoshia linei TaxID=1819745 RepID=A0A177B4P7_9BILA|nr:hypothetical protein A3Q56_03861 [Intoshia linei]
MLDSWRNLSSRSDIFRRICSTARRKFSLHDDYLNKNLHPVKNAPSVNDPAERALMKYKKSIQLLTDATQRQMIVSTLNF